MSRTNVTALPALAAALIGVAVAGRSQPAPPDGRALYEARCGGCHSIGANRVGPLHRGVVGRRAGTAPGFAYSPALRDAGVIWTRQNLDRWLQGPQQMVRGSRMFTTVANPDERAAIITYLASQSP